MLRIEKGKIVDNFKCYIATIVESENAMAAKVGDDLTLRLSSTDEIKASIVHIVEEDGKRIIVFEIDEKVAELIEYRKISLDIIWWKYTGLKVSNQALIEENETIMISADFIVEKMGGKMVFDQEDGYGRADCS